MPFILDYFDLNKRAAKGKRVPVPPTQVSNPGVRVRGLDPGVSRLIIGIPDDSGLHNPYTVPFEAEVSYMPVWEQLVMYGGTVIGVIFSSYVLQFVPNSEGVIQFSLTTLLISAVIALAIMPIIYEKAVKRNAPFLAQLGFFVQHGVFWSLLLEAISKKL
jgi:hypothetical protein